MPYNSKQELPDSVQHVLPAHAQEIYKEAFNSAWDQYKDKDLGLYQTIQVVAYDNTTSLIIKQHVRQV